MLLSVEQVTKSYGDRVPLDGVSFIWSGGQGGDHRRQRRRQVHPPPPAGGGGGAGRGTVRLDPGVRMEYLPQNPVFQGSAPCWSRCCWG